MKSEKDDNGSSDRKSLLVKGTKNVLLSLVVYFIGYMNWSITWIIIPVIVGIVSDERKKKNLKRRNLIRDVAMGNEEEVILDHIKDLPAWVYFPDIERVEWLNRIIKQFWPNVNHYFRDLIKTVMEDVLKANLEKYTLKGFRFQRIILGNVPFRIGGIIVYENVSRDEIVMDLDVSYAGDCDVKFRLRGLNGGLKNFQLYGRLRIVMKPLIKDLPFTGGLQIFFLNNPDIDFDLDGIAGILEIPGIRDLLKKSIADTVSSLMVLPNKYPVKLSKEVSEAQLKTPCPAGVLRVHVIEAKELVRKDIGFTGLGKSDPYTVLEVGDQVCRTETIDCTLNPKWDFWCEFVILEINGQNLYIHVWDHDATDDESLGKTSVDISNLIKAGQSDLWLSLEEVKHGKIHIRCTWMTLSTDYADLQAAVYETSQLQLTYMNTALLTVFIDSATNLPQVKASSKPDPYAQISVGKQVKSTKTIMRTINPVWEEGFIFFISNPDSDCLDLKVLDSKTDNELCTLCYNISNLSNKENLEILQQPFKLEKGLQESQVVWSLHLKILKNENLEEYLEEFLKERRQSTISTASKSSLENHPSNSTNNSITESVFERTSKSSTRSSGMSNASFIKRRRKRSKSTSEPLDIGKVNLTLRYSVQRQRLVIVVHSISNLPYKDDSGRDIYVKLYLLPERQKEVKRKTSIKNSHDPTFDETFEYLISQGELSSKKLEISVIEMKMMRNYILGEVIIDLAKLDMYKTNTEWFTLGPHLKKD